MAISLNKGGNLSLSKTDPGLKKLLIGLGWDERATSGAEFDLDASVFLLTTSGKVRGDHDFIFYNQLKSADGAVEHTGDNRSGAGDGDDEAVHRPAGEARQQAGGEHRRGRETAHQVLLGSHAHGIREPCHPPHPGPRLSAAAGRAGCAAP